MKKFALILTLTIVSGVTFGPGTAEARIISQECRKLLGQWKSKKGHKAFVIGREQGFTEYCGMAWSKKSKAAAINSAISACKRVGAGRCNIYRAE